MKACKELSYHISLEQQRLLYSTYYKNVYQTVYNFCKDPYLSEELTQDAFLIAFQKMDTLLEMGKFKAWICSIALNLTRDYIRRNAKLCFLPTVESLGHGLDCVEDRVMKSFDKKRIQLAIGQLDQHYKNIIILRYYYDMSYKEIAQKLHLNDNTVKTRIKRAKGKLYGLLN